MLPEHESDFFNQLYQVIELQRGQLRAKLDELFLCERLDMVKQRDRVIFSHRLDHLRGGLDGFPATAYQRKLDQQEAARASMLSHAYFMAFELLQIDAKVYETRLAKEMQVWHLRAELLKSPHRADRQRAEDISSTFIDTFKLVQD